MHQCSHRSSRVWSLLSSDLVRGNVVDVMSISLASAASLHNERNWFAKDISMTSEGWPSAAARFTSRPRARRWILFPFSSGGEFFVILSNGSNGRWRDSQVCNNIDFAIVIPSVGYNGSILHQLGKVAPSTMMSFIPVAVQKMSPNGAASSMVMTLLPSITARSAAVDLTSVTITLIGS